MREYAELFKNASADALIIISEKNRSYFTQFNSTAGYLILLPTKALFVTDARYFQMATEHMGEEIELALIDSCNPAMTIIKNYLSSNNVMTVGFEDTELTVSEYNQLTNFLSAFTLVGYGERIELVRRIKSEDEISNIVKAQSITDAAFSEIIKFIKPGMTEKDIAVELEYRMARNGAMGLAFDTIIASGTNTSKPHAHPTNKVVAKGDAITMDYGARFNGYCSDMTRTIFVGEPSAEMIKIYEVVKQAQVNALDNAYIGITGHELDSLAREVIVANGYGKYFVHSTGHSLGVDIHESPRAMTNSNDIFKPNMLVTVEPGIYVPDVGGVRIEDMILFQQDNVINLTKSSKDIIIL